MDNKIFKLVEKLKNESLGIIRDYKNGHVEYEFAEGVVIGYNTVLDFIEKIYDININDYKTDINFE